MDTMATVDFSPPPSPKNKLPVVVIIGGGFGGLAAARTLKKAPVKIILIDRTNHHLFQPLLYQAATAGLTSANIAKPIRSILRRQQNASVIQGEVVAIDPEKRQVSLKDQVFSYDYLIVATGARHAYFGKDQWEAIAPGLKTAKDALEIRRRILTAFEWAERTPDTEVKKAALTFVIVGAGPTGVELAGAIAELAHFTLAKDFRHINPKDARILLVEAGARILPSFSPALSEKAKQQLKNLRVDVLTGKRVTDIAFDHVMIDEQRIDTRTVIWAAGNKASPLAAMLGGEIDRQGRVVVHPDLTLPHHPEIQAIGDMAAMASNGRPVPGVAPAAMQAGRHAARNILAMLQKQPCKPFRYIDKGNLATIGRYAAVAEIGPFKFSGSPAWFAWVFVHLIFLISFRNRFFVFLNWILAYFSYARGARLIPETDEAQS